MDFEFEASRDDAGGANKTDYNKHGGQPDPLLVQDPNMMKNELSNELM